jgi:small-conductance mechanosensitive channel
VSAAVESTYARYASTTPDAARVRRVRTQVVLIMRIVTFTVAVVAVAAILLTFPGMRAVGTSMLASAGIIGIVAGVAAQSTLGNLFAGFQIAFGDMVRIGDTVVVDGEWGTVEEVNLTFLAVRTWDERRITMPVSYFTSKPFENWSRGGLQMTGTVFFQLDHSAPVRLMREKLREILEGCPAWDRRDWSLAVTDSTPSTMEVRAVVTAKDANDIWTARCAVREQMLRWLSERHPYALPRIATASAAVLPPDGWHPSAALREVKQPSGSPDGDRPRTGRG